MIEAEGRVLNGLDEFMLRLGHLSVLLRIASDVGASWRHISKEASALLGTDVGVSTASNGEIADYLAQKDLCPTQGGKAKNNEEFRYPNLVVDVMPDGRKYVRSLEGEDPIVSWQDRNLASAVVPSRVGAITTAGRRGSKTGLSHVCDWAQFLELINSTGQLSANARLLVALHASRQPILEWNPYILDGEQLIYGYEYLLRDFDVFCRFAPRLVASNSRLTKAMCRDLFIESLLEVAKESERSQVIAPRNRFELMQQIRDLERAARKSDTSIEKTSTAWHRTASRVETLVDLGLLTKDRRNAKEKYQYIYYPTERLQLAVDFLQGAQNAEEWVFDRIASILLKSGGQPGGQEEFLNDLASVVRLLNLPTSLLPIPCLALGIVSLQSARGECASLTAVRAMLEQLPTKNPDFARLARGRSGTRAEFISVNLQRLSGLQQTR